MRTPGDHLATTQAVALVPVREEIAWSRDLDHELALLGEFSKLRAKFEQIPTPPARYESNILPLLPQDTILYVSIPNLGEALEQANQVFQQQLAESPVLQQWWGGVDRSPQRLEELLAQVRALSRFLGDEVVITMSGGSKDGPVLLSEVRDPGLENFLQNHLAGAFTVRDGVPDLHVVNPQSLASLADNTHGVVMLVRQNMLVVGGDAKSVRQMNAQIDGGTKPFGNTDFAQRILSVYSGGAETLVAVNFATILNTPENSTSMAFQTSGFNNVKYLVATRSDTPNHGDNRLTLEFAGARVGIPSWLAEPAPMGSLDYVSANAEAAVSVVAKQPALMFDDLLSVLSSDPHFSSNLAEMNAKLGFDLRDGYLLLAPSRALLLAALDTHARGSSLARSASFRSLLPSDSQANFSGMLYQNLSPVLKPLASQVTSQQFAVLQQLAADSKPSVICAYGGTDRIEVASNGTLLDLNPGLMTLFHLLGRADHGTSLSRNP